MPYMALHQGIVFLSVCGVCGACIHVCGACIHVCGACIHVCGVCIHVCGVCIHVCGVCIHVCVVSYMCAVTYIKISQCSSWSATLRKHLIV